VEAVYFKFILSLGLVLIFARIFGELFERYFKQPAVLGELVAGIIISPFLLGGLISHHDLIILNFATVHNPFGLQGDFDIMYIIANIAVVILLFQAGVETDIRSFLKQAPTGFAVAFGGVVLPFVGGYFVTRALCPDVGIGGWLFMGAVLTATSIGVTVRILMDMGRLNTPEGTTILVAAVVDDIIGLIILSIVIGLAETGEFEILEAVKIGAIGFAVWFALLAIGIKLNKYISRFLLNPFKSSGTAPIVALIIGFLVAYLVTLVDLHPVVGAYVAGLMFSACQEKEEIMEKGRPIMLFAAPFFFAYLGMMVNLRLFGAPGAAILAVLLIVVAIVGKLIGCYIPARFAGKLSHNSGMIVGVGMIPRAEVGLIVAAAGYIAGAISLGLYGAAVAVSVVTTLITPAMLKPFFKRQLTQVSEPVSGDSNSSNSA
jgi:Kef-type K+ transport system membrane component KefB